jgi:cell division protein FtsL
MRILNKSHTRIVVLIGICLSLFSVVHIDSLFADSTVEELQQKIDERNKNIEQLNKEIQTYKDLADKTGN